MTDDTLVTLVFREVKIADPSAVVSMEYDKLAVNGRKYSWSDAAHAVLDLQDNKVTDVLQESS